jgi:uncharacterized damage-inducible protein DinB
MKEALIHLYQRDLTVLYQEIEKFSTETQLWQTVDGITNSSGNLALHLLGNLNTYFGKNLGNTGYVRNRPAEFADKDIPKAQILQQIDDVQAVVMKVLENLSPEQMEAIYPENVLGYEMKTLHFLIHLHGHLTYHLGQINYLRRIL